MGGEEEGEREGERDVKFTYMQYAETIVLCIQ